MAEQDVFMKAVLVVPAAEVCVADASRIRTRAATDLLEQVSIFYIYIYIYGGEAIYIQTTF